MRSRLASILAACALCAAPFAAHAQAWPTKPVRIIVPFVAGGTTDVVARLLGQKLSEAWGQSVVVEDKAGAGGNIGADAAAKAAPDGYTLFMTSGSIVTANQHLYKVLPFDPARDLIPITEVATGPQVVAVSASLAVRDLRDLIAYAKGNPRRLNFGSAGVGTQTHLAGENFFYAAGIEVTHVPYKGEASVINDLMGGQIQMATPNLGAAISYIQAGKLRALAVTSPERVPQLPDIPTVAEVLPGFENAGWFGLMAPAGTPQDVIDRVYRDSAKILGSEEFRARLAQQGMRPVGNTPGEFAALIREESARWAKVIRERGLVIN